MIKSFGDRATEEIFHGGWAKKLPRTIQIRARRLLIQIDAAVHVVDLGLPLSNRLHKLQNDYWSVSINDQWRITFTFQNGNAFDVNIEDYH